MSKRIETDLMTFIKFWLVPIGVVVVGFLLFKALTGLIIVGASIFLALALRPLVRKVDGLFAKMFGEDKKHRNVSAIFAYLIVVAVIGAILIVVGPVIVNETARFVQNFPETFETTFGGWSGINNFGQTLGIADLQGEVSKAVSNVSDSLLGVLGNNLVTSVSNIADVTMKIVMVLVLTLLFLLEGPEMINNMWERLDDKRGNHKTIKVVRRTLSRMAGVISTYVSRQMLVAMLDGLATTIIVFVLALVLNFSPSLALPMGMITMIFYMIPMFGQFIGGTSVTILLFFSNPVAAAAFAVIYIIYAQIENNLISPKIQGDALNLKAVVILVAIVIGTYTLGLAGAIIAIPIAGCIRVLLDEYPNLRAAQEQ